MTDVSNDLVTWLRAQLDDDERVARDAGGESWEPKPVYEPEQDIYEVYSATDREIVWHYVNEGGGTDRVSAMHITRWDPARVLAEVEAKRRIIHLHPTVSEDWATEFAGDCQMCSESAPCRTVRELAFPYAGRPGYREEWRP